MGGEHQCINTVYNISSDTSSNWVWCTNDGTIYNPKIPLLSDKFNIVIILEPATRTARYWRLDRTRDVPQDSTKYNINPPMPDLPFNTFYGKRPGGVYWDDDTNIIYYIYGDSYHLGTIILNETSFEFYAPTAAPPTNEVTPVPSTMTPSDNPTEFPSKSPSSNPSQFPTDNPTNSTSKNISTTLLIIEFTSELDTDDQIIISQIVRNIINNVTNINCISLGDAKYNTKNLTVSLCKKADEPLIKAYINTDLAKDIINQPDSPILSIEDIVVTLKEEIVDGAVKLTSTTVIAPLKDGGSFKIAGLEAEILYIICGSLIGLLCCIIMILIFIVIKQRKLRTERIMKKLEMKILI